MGPKDCLAAESVLGLPILDTLSQLRFVETQSCLDKNISQIMEMDAKLLMMENREAMAVVAPAAFEEDASRGNILLGRTVLWMDQQKQDVCIDVGRDVL